MNSKNSIEIDSIKLRLNDALDAVLSEARNCENQALEISSLNRDQQDFTLYWLDIIVKTNCELGYQFITNISEALRQINLDQARAWIIQALHIYDHRGLYPSSKFLNSFKEYLLHINDSSTVLLDAKISMVLSYYFKGLSGIALTLEKNERAYISMATLYLPQKINFFKTYEDNFTTYQLIVLLLWAQTKFRTFKTPTSLSHKIIKDINNFPNRNKAVKIFEILEGIRLEENIKRNFPGIAKKITRLRKSCDRENYEWTEEISPLLQIEASVYDSLKLTKKIYSSCDKIYPSLPWTPSINFISSKKNIDLNLKNYDSSKNQIRKTTAQDHSLTTPTFTEPFKKFSEIPTNFSSENESTELNSLAQSNFVSDLHSKLENTVCDKEEKQENEDSFIYDEWDHLRNDYRKAWCSLKEINLPEEDTGFYEKTLEKYPYSLKKLKNTFEALRLNKRRAKRQSTGDEIDLDALVEAKVNAFTGEEMTDKVLSRLEETGRDIAVIVMVDISGSTKGWVNKAERECLVLLCEALKIIQDKFAIYGFSGVTRQRCELYIVKDFHEPFSNKIKNRIAGLEAKDYTRMGVAIRHATKKIIDVKTKSKILITLSDGKPDDYDGYRGRYGIEDTRQALKEAKSLGVHPFCVTIDKHANEYLSHMYGPANFAVLDNAQSLPTRISNIYRRLTS